MRLSRTAITVYVALVFASGAVLGAFGHRLYTVSTVSAKVQRNPEEYRKREVEEYRQRLKLNDDQVAKFEAILDETRARVDETRQKLRPTYEKIHIEQQQKFHDMLTPDQQAEYDRIRKERQQRNGGRRGPGF